MIHSQAAFGDNMVGTRKVKTIVPTHTVTEGGGFKVRRPAAMGSLMSPFLLLDEMGPANYGPGEAVGAPWHPHRGFETVTYMLSGEMEHEDSVGSKGVITPGDVGGILRHKFANYTWVTDYQSDEEKSIYIAQS